MWTQKVQKFKKVKVRDITEIFTLLKERWKERSRVDSEWFEPQSNGLNTTPSDSVTPATQSQVSKLFCQLTFAALQLFTAYSFGVILSFAATFVKFAENSAKRAVFENVTRVDGSLTKLQPQRDMSFADLVGGTYWEFSRNLKLYKGNGRWWK